MRPARAVSKSRAISRPISIGRHSPTGKKSGTDHTPARTKCRFVRLSDRDERAERHDYDKGVSGRLIEVGRAPYRNRNDAEPSTYVAIELDNGRQHQVWGVGLEKATADSKARPGDRIQVRRDGVERVAKDIKVIDASKRACAYRTAAGIAQPLAGDGGEISLSRSADCGA